MTVIFKAKSTDAFYLKILIELLSKNLKDGCFEVDENGIKLGMMDQNKRTLIDINLESEKFNLYKFKGEKLFLGINLNHFHGLLKSIKKKDSIQFYIDDDSPMDLGIKVIPNGNNSRVTTSYIKIQNMQNMEVGIPTGYGKSVIVSSSEYQKMCKDIGNVGTKNMTITSKKQSITFSCDAGDILKRSVQFGESDDSDTDEEEEDDKESIYHHGFFVEQITRITKISGLSGSSGTMQIFPGCPIRFKSNIGSIGTISIYIKSKEEIEEEELKQEEDEDDDDDNN